MQPQTPQPTFQTQNATDPQKSKKSKKIITGLLVVLALIGVGVGAWWYGDSQATSKADVRIESLQKQIDELKSTVKTSDANEDSDKKYLNIAQWDVKLQPTAATMSYKLVTLEGVQTLQLTNADVAELGGSCTEESYLAVVSRYDSRQTDAESSEAFEGKFLKKIGNYHYYVVGSNGTCSDNPQEMKIRSEILAAAETLEAL